MYLKREDTLADMDPKKSRGKWKSLFKKQTALNNIGLTRAITSKIKSQIKEEEAMEQEQQAANNTGEAATKEQPPNQEKQILERSPNSSSIEKKTHFEDNGDNLEEGVGKKQSKQTKQTKQTTWLNMISILHAF